MEYLPGSINTLVERAHNTAVKHGFWEKQDPHDTMVTLARLALITSEVGEAVEALRVPDEAGLEEELADIVIRVMDLAGARHLNLEAAMLAKMAKNDNRPWLHGKLA